MDYFYWLLISGTFLVAFLALIYPIIPGVFFLLLGYILYGFFYTFESFTTFFWTIQILLVLLLFGADYLGNYIGVKKYGGSKAAVWGSTIGLIIGPFVIPVLGIVIGPFIGAIFAEILIHRTTLKEAVKIGVGSVIGFFSSVLMKSLVQIIMISYFLLVVL